MSLSAKTTIDLPEYSDYQYDTEYSEITINGSLVRIRFSDREFKDYHTQDMRSLAKAILKLTEEQSK